MTSISRQGYPRAQHIITHDHTMGRYNDNMKHTMKHTRTCLYIYIYYVASIKLHVLRLMKD